MADYTVQNLDDDGTAPDFDATPPDAANTAPVGSGSNTFLVVKNSDASPHTVTVTVPGDTDYGEPNPDRSFSVAASGERWIPLRRAYRDPNTPGKCAWNITDGLTGVTAAVVRLS